MNTVFGIVVGLLGIACGLWLLISLEKISGAEFVAFSFGFAVMGLIIAFAEEVQEFSIAGNGVKLKELRSEAEETIKQLQQARTELFRILVQNSIELSGGFADSSKIESRAEKFIHLFDEVEKINRVNELKSDLQRSLKIIMLAQYNKFIFIHKNRKNLEDTFTDSDKAHFLYIALTDDIIRESYKNRSPEPNFQNEKEDIINAIGMYAKLYSIKMKIDEIEN